MGERWMNRWTRIELSRRSALRGIGGTVAATAGIAASKGELAMAQEEGTPAAEPAADFKVVFHIGEVQNWQFVLSNLKNVTQDWPQAEIRLVVDGSAVLVLQGKNSLTNELTEVAGKGVEVQVCPNALAEHEIEPATIPSYASTSTGGVVALIVAQEEGFHYIKP